MPVSVNADLVRLSQEEFSSVAYRVMSEVFSIHSQYGRLFDEAVYEKALAERFEDAQSEVCIEVSFRDFQKLYYMDLVVGAGAVFELKTVDMLHARHASQLLNYLLLTGLQHGKLINFRSRSVEHKFVNTTHTYADRIQFDVVDTDWHETDGFRLNQKNLVCEMVRDWGTGLERALYEEALLHFCGGPELASKSIGVLSKHRLIAEQSSVLCSHDVALKVTTIERNLADYRQELMRFLQRTNLDAMQWVNISRSRLTFETLQQNGRR